MIGALPARVANLRRLIRALAQEMTGKCIAEFLGMSESGSRKYIHDLAPVIHLVRRVDAGPKSIGQPVYRLTSDVEAVERFMFALDATVAPPTPRKKTVKAVDATRHVHICPDDEMVLVKHRRLPKVDSYALPVEFFRVSPKSPEWELVDDPAPMRMLTVEELAAAQSFSSPYAMTTACPPCAHFAIQSSAEVIA